MQAIGKDRFLVGSSVAIGVLVNEDHVVGFGVAWFVVRVAGQGRNPQAALIVKTHLGRVAQVREILLGSKHRDFVAFGQRESLESFFFAFEVVRVAVLLAHAEVRFN